MITMRELLRNRWIVLATAAGLAISLTGCTSFHDYIHNGLKVGPNYCQPDAPVADHWIDAAQVQQAKDA